MLYKDSEIIQLKQLFHKNGNDLYQIYGEISLDNNRFLTKHNENMQLIDEHKSDDDDIDIYEIHIDVKTEQYNEYFFGPRDSIDEITDEHSDSMYFKMDRFQK